MKKVLSIICVAFLATGLFGQDKTETIVSKREILNAHTFQSLSYFRPSFTSTHLAANIGFGTTPALKIGSIAIDSLLLFEFEGQVVFVDVAVRYQQRFTPWLAMYLQGNMAGRLGADMSTILADGVNMITGFKIGWLIRFYQSKKVNLSANVHVSSASANFMNISQYFEDLINNKPNPSVTQTVPAMAIDVGVTGAYAITPTWGLQYFGDIAFGESFERNRSQTYFNVGVEGEIDFNPNYKVPIGLALGYVATNNPESVSDNSGFSNIFIGKIGYSGSKEFDLGLQFSYFDVNLRSVEDQVYVFKTMLMLKFFF